MACALRIITELENTSTDKIIMEVTRHLGMMPVVRLDIPPGQVKDLCYGDLHAGDNPDRPILMCVFVEGAAEQEKKYILPTLVRDNSKLVFNYENGKVNNSMPSF